MNIKTSSNLNDYSEYFKQVNYVSKHKNKTGYESLRGKEVHKYSLEGIYLESYGSVKEAAKIHNCCNVGICNCIKKIEKGINASAYNYIWSYTKKDKINKWVNERGLSTSRCIYQYDSNKNFIKKFDTISQAIKEVNGNYANIIVSAKSNFKLKHMKYYWSYNKV